MTNETMPNTGLEHGRNTATIDMRRARQASKTPATVPISPLLERAMLDALDRDDALRSRFLRERWRGLPGAVRE